jgi:hypothetical protein
VPYWIAENDNLVRFGAFCMSDVECVSFLLVHGLNAFRCLVCAP